LDSSSLFLATSSLTSHSDRQEGKMPTCADARARAIDSSAMAGGFSAIRASQARYGRRGAALRHAINAQQCAHPGVSSAPPSTSAGSSSSSSAPASSTSSPAAAAPSPSPSTRTPTSELFGQQGDIAGVTSRRLPTPRAGLESRPQQDHHQADQQQRPSLAPRTRRQSSPTGAHPLDQQHRQTQASQPSWRRELQRPSSMSRLLTRRRSDGQTHDLRPLRFEVRRSSDAGLVGAWGEDSDSDDDEEVEVMSARHPAARRSSPRLGEESSQSQTPLPPLPQSRRRPSSVVISRGASEGMLRALPSKEVTTDMLNTMPEERRTCAICLGEYEVGETQMTLPCFHCFHNACAEQWLSRVANCPLCKHSLTCG